LVSRARSYLSDWRNNVGSRENPFDSIVLGLSVASISQSAIALVMFMAGRVSEFSVSSAAACLFAAVLVKFHGQSGRWERRATYSTPMATSDRYCRDCGREMTVSYRQAGFDPKTGNPKLVSKFECPDRDAAIDRINKSYMAMSSSLRSFGPPDWIHDRKDPWCHESVTANPGAHNHKLADEPTSTKCPVCVRQLLDNKAIDLPTAQKLLAS
jgi:hypothetical protein